MPLNIAFEFLIAAIELIRLALIAAIPCFAIVLAAEQLHKKAAQRFKLSWAQATLFSTYLIVTLLIMVLYALPFYLGWLESPLSRQPIPVELQPTLFEVATAALFSIAKILISGAIFTVLLLPFAFFATYVLEKIAEKKRLPAFANKFVAVFAACLLAWLLLLFVFPFAFGGLVYLVYWG